MKCFDLTTDQTIAHIKLIRPEAMNKMDHVFWRELDDVLSDLHKA